MRDVLVSLKPYFYYLIGEGIKTIEIRKTFPKADDWSKNTWFYMSKDEKSFAKIPKEFQDKYRKHFGKVGLKFVCDEIIGTCPWRLKGETGFCAKRTEKETNLPNNACLTLEEIEKYAGSRGRGIYGWHISDLVIYDKPRELSEFKYHCKYEFDDDFKHCDRCEYYYFSNTPSNGREEWCGCDGIKTLKRPPQSYMFVELGV
jgi:predicted transcriptional regulator